MHVCTYLFTGPSMSCHLVDYSTNTATGITTYTKISPIPTCIETFRRSDNDTQIGLLTSTVTVITPYTEISPIKTSCIETFRTSANDIQIGLLVAVISMAIIAIVATTISIAMGGLLYQKRVHTKSGTIFDVTEIQPFTENYNFK